MQRHQELSARIQLGLSSIVTECLLLSENPWPLSMQHRPLGRQLLATALVVFCIICSKLNNTVLPILSLNSKDNSLYNLFYQWSK